MKANRATRAIGAAIGEARRTRGLTQAQLGARLRVSRTTIARYEQGLRLLSVQMLIALADALEASADTLLGRRVA